MAEGTSTFNGLGVPLLGESEIAQQTAATDILTITGASSQTGDFLVLQNSTGGEVLVITSSGAIQTTNAPSHVLSSTTQVSALTISVTSTGALADVNVTTVNGILVSPSSKAVLNTAFMYISGSTHSEVNSAVSLLGVSGSKAPTYFLKIGTTAGYGTGAAASNGFFTTGKVLTSDPTSATSFGVLKVLVGSKAHYILMVPDTAIT